jgi:ABC-type Mn2+/Zn2+ transport system ATPase subunit
MNKSYLIHHNRLSLSSIQLKMYPATIRATDFETMDNPEIGVDFLHAEFRVLQRLNSITKAPIRLLNAIESNLRPIKDQNISMIDFGAGIGDIPRAAIKEAKKRGWNLSVMASDNNPDVLKMCRESGSTVGMSFQQVDILNPPASITEKSFEVAHASLMLHHLSDAKVVDALRTMSFAASKLILWNDLIRNPLGVFGARLSTIGANRAVRDDAILSVRRAFTTSEAEAFAEAAGLTDITFPQRIGARFLLCARPSATNDPARHRPIIHCEKISFRYGTHQVLKDFSIIVRAGEVAVLRGKNGSGKTTLFRILSGAIQQESGRAWCDRTNKAIAYLPQQGGLMSSIDLQSNIHLTQQLAQTPRNECEKRGRNAIEQFGMQNLISVPIARLSVGQAKRAALATVFAVRSPVLLLDEPESALDADGRERLFIAIMQKIRDHCAVLLATHDTLWLRDSTQSAMMPMTETSLS